MKNFFRKEIMNKNKQELPVFYRLSGVIYLAYCDYTKEQESFFGKKDFFLYNAQRETRRYR